MSKARIYHLRNKYGITEKQYNTLLHKQNGCCAVCERSASAFNKRLSVDHNHKTGVIRGLLCFFCNKFVIGRHTDAKLFERAGEYLKQSTGWVVPTQIKKRKKRKRGTRSRQRSKPIK